MDRQNVLALKGLANNLYFMPAEISILTEYLLLDSIAEYANLGQKWLGHIFRFP